MLQAPLPSMPEYDSLDDHLDELEEPGTNLLQDFILRSNGPQALGVSNTTPLSISNGYTSEESDYSVTTPSDEQMYSDMSFLQSADTSELVEVVADFVKDNDLTVLSPQQQRAFADKSAFLATGKMIKGKTSKYRGVTQTSKSSWGAKYSAKRITNTCKTPDEAARAYDSYLKTNYPDKFRKFANFCVRCDSFVNPLGLPEFRNECRCDAVSDGGSTEVESPPTASETDIDDLESHQKLYARQDSNLSISSLKLSFLEDTEPFFDESMLPPLDDPQYHEKHELMDGEKKPIKRDSLTMAAVESFTNDGNLDQIIHDIDRSSSLSKKPSFSSSGLAPPSSSTTAAADFSPEEWQNLSEYLMTEQQVSTGSRPPPSRSAQENNQRFAYKKIHSLDFDPVDAMDQSMAIKQEYASAMDVDDLASAFMPPPSDSSTYNGPMATPTATLPVQTHSSALFPARVEIQTPFLEKYWRNDRKNIQCFPYCPEHGDYYRVRIENLQHRCKGVCRAAIKAQITIPTTQPLSPSGLVLLARCNSTFSRNVALSTQQYLNATEIKNLQTLSAVGMVENFGVLPDGSGVQFEVTFYPDVWKFEFDLPKKRRHGGAGDADPDNSNSEFLYFFEIDVFYTAEKTSFQRLGHAESMSFQIGNTRTLLRQRNRMTEEPSDSDRVLGVEAMPERKKVKMYLGQLARNSTVTSEDGEYVDPAMVSGETTHPRKFVDGDALGRIDSKDSAFDLEASEDSDDGPVTYGRYLSPKGTKAAPAGADAATVATMTQSGTKTAREAERDNEAVATKQTHDSHSWAQLFSYTLLCVPLSIVFAPLALVLFVPFLVLPPLSGAIVRVLDALSDSELRRANSSCVASDTRFVLDRLDTGAGKGMLRFHGQGAVWSRFVYFFVKLVMSVVVFVPTLVLSVLGLILFPIRPASQALLRTANSIALISRDFTRKSVGKPFGSSSAPASHGVQGDALV